MAGETAKRHRNRRDWMKIHHNTFQRPTCPPSSSAAATREVNIHHNWFYLEHSSDGGHLARVADRFSGNAAQSIRTRA
jgi:hypothetical protein